MSAQRLYHNMPYSVVAFVALVPVAAVWVFLIGGGILRAGGVFEYPLDDVYIHLAMAEQIARGGYGVNVNEAASAASSPLYPFLLAPFAQDSIGRMVPFALNLIVMVGAVLVWALICWRALPEDNAGRAWVLIGAGLAPAGLNLAGATMTAMEHTPHIAATLMIVAGLQKWAQGRGVSWMLVAGILLAPALRLEGLALALAAAVVIGVERPKRGAILGAVALLPIAVFMVFSSSLGLEALPSSVVSKLSDGISPSGGAVAQLFGGVAQNLNQTGGLFLAVLSGLLLLSARGVSGRMRSAALAILAAGFAQDFARTPVAVNNLGRVAWGNENYVLDLWGLANAQARAKRLNQPQVGWAGELVRAQNVPLVMVYDHWIDEGLGDDWTRLGALRMQNPAGFLGGAEVQFYAADPASIRSLNAALRLWEKGLPRDAVFEFSKEGV
ncbi:hypothetical protein [Nereida sp.]|uniref:hypothetical protein n=1 Tax=Nereida sp. TaxID=2736090 RepID=UPI003F69B20F